MAAASDVNDLPDALHLLALQAPSTAPCTMAARIRGAGWPANNPTAKANLWDAYARAFVGLGVPPAIARRLWRRPCLRQTWQPSSSLWQPRRTCRMTRSRACSNDPPRHQLYRQSPSKALIDRNKQERSTMFSRNKTVGMRHNYCGRWQRNLPSCCSRRLQNSSKRHCRLNNNHGYHSSNNSNRSSSSSNNSNRSNSSSSNTNSNPSSSSSSSKYRYRRDVNVNNPKRRKQGTTGCRRVLLKLECQTRRWQPFNAKKLTLR